MSRRSLAVELFRSWSASHHPRSPSGEWIDKGGLLAEPSRYRNGEPSGRPYRARPETMEQRAQTTRSHAAPAVAGYVSAGNGGDIRAREQLAPPAAPGYHHH